jgi:hypothetical protein
MKQTTTWCAVLAAVLAPIAALGQSVYIDVALERTVRDDDRGIRAVVRYRPEVPYGGQDEIINDDGSVSIIHWDGVTGQFTAEIIEGVLAESDAEAFLRDAVVAVCPSVERERLANEWVQSMPPFYSIHSQCPEVDDRLE